MPETPAGETARLCTCGQPLHPGSILASETEHEGPYEAIVTAVGPTAPEPLHRKLDVVVLTDNQFWQHAGDLRHWQMEVGTPVRCGTTDDVPPPCPPRSARLPRRTPIPAHLAGATQHSRWLKRRHVERRAGVAGPISLALRTAVVSSPSNANSADAGGHGEDHPRAAYLCRTLAPPPGADAGPQRAAPGSLPAGEDRLPTPSVGKAARASARASGSLVARRAASSMAEL